MLAPFLTEAPNLKALRFEACSLWNDDVNFLSYKMMDRSTNTLEELDVSGNDIDDDDLDILAMALQKNQSVKHVDLGSNKISGNAARSLAKTIESNESGVETLNLSHNSICDEDASILIDSLGSNSKLTTLDLQGNACITDEGWTSISYSVLQLVCNNSGVFGASVSNHTLSSLGHLMMILSFHIQAKGQGQITSVYDFIFI